MFGKRSATAELSPQAPPPRIEPAAAKIVAPPQAAEDASAAPPPRPQGAPTAPMPSKPLPRIADSRSDDYYQIKTTIFNALIDTIDLAQLAQLDPDSAREEIRDIVNEIISIKAVVMSIAEQEHLLQDICNDVLGYGPLEPLLARDTIDLAQLAQLDPDSAREEIRDIVNEIISIKAVVMSIAEQEHLLQDICNDVLGY